MVARSRGFQYESIFVEFNIPNPIVLTLEKQSLVGMRIDELLRGGNIRKSSENFQGRKGTMLLDEHGDWKLSTDISRLLNENAHPLFTLCGLKGNGTLLFFDRSKLTKSSAFLGNFRGGSRL